MGGFFGRLFDTSDFPARWSCGNWTAGHGWLHIISDGLIFTAYFAIPITLLVMVRRRPVPFSRVALLFVAFILLCGLTHAIEASIFWWPAYRLSGLMKALTAAVSVATAISMVWVLPRALELPSVVTLNRDLAAALEGERGARADLEAARAKLEDLSGRVVVKERRMRDAMVGATACAIRWEAATGRVAWEVGFAQLSARVGEVPEAMGSWEDLIGPDAAAELADACGAACGSRGWLHRRFPLRGSEGVWDVRLTASAVQDAEGRYTLMSGVFGLMRFGESLPEGL